MTPSLLLTIVTWKDNMMLDSLLVEPQLVAHLCQEFSLLANLPLWKLRIMMVGNSVVGHIVSIDLFIKCWMLPSLPLLLKDLLACMAT